MGIWWVFNKKTGYAY